MTSPRERRSVLVTSQLFTVARYEFLRILRSRRLLGVILGSIVLVAVAYVLPTTYGGPYAGHRETRLFLEPYSHELYPGYSCIAYITTEGLDPSSIVVHANGSLLSPSDYFVSNDGSGAIFFKPNLLLSDVVANYDFSTTPEQFAITLLEFMQVFVAFVAVFLGSDAIVRDFSEHTGFITFTTPVRKDVLMVGKFVSSLFSGALALFTYYIALAVLSYVTLGGVAEYLPLSLGCSVLFCFLCLAFAFLVSSASKGITPSVVVTLLVLLLILPAIQAAGEEGAGKMWFLPTFAAGIIKYSLLFEHYPDVQAKEVPDLGLSTVVLIAYGIAFLLVCGYLFSRREMRE